MDIIGSNTDYYGVNNINIECGETENPTTEKLGDLGLCSTEGIWQPKIYCDEGYSVCGMKTWVQSALGLNGGSVAIESDDMAMTDIELYCCPLF